MWLLHGKNSWLCVTAWLKQRLPQETPVDLLTGLTLCSVDDFNTLFKHKLQVAKAESLEGNHHLSQPEIMGEVCILLASSSVLQQSQHE
jgi:hypothetical protein